MKYYLQGAGVALCLVAVVAVGIYVPNHNESKEKEEYNIVEEYVFNNCVIGVPTTDIEYRRACGRAAYAFAHGKKDYEAYGQVFTWDKEARIYVVKEKVK